MPEEEGDDNLENVLLSPDSRRSPSVAPWQETQPTRSPGSTQAGSPGFGSLWQEDPAPSTTVGVAVASPLPLLNASPVEELPPSSTTEVIVVASQSTLQQPPSASAPELRSAAPPSTGSTVSIGSTVLAIGAAAPTTQEIVAAATKPSDTPLLIGYWAHHCGRATGEWVGGGGGATSLSPPAHSKSPSALAPSPHTLRNPPISA